MRINFGKITQPINNEKTMQNTHLKKTVTLLTVCLLMVSGLNVKGEENDDIRNTAEKFVRQICEKDADANNVRISGMYGLKIDFTEITDISLMENTIGSIGLTMRTNGYGTSSTQKGYFQSNRYGSVLLFTKTNSSPTIHIEREGKADVFLNFSNEEETRILYNDLKTAFAR
jgi:hypothetical protein